MTRGAWVLGTIFLLCLVGSTWLTVSKLEKIDANLSLLGNLRSTIPSKVDLSVTRTPKVVTVKVQFQNSPHVLIATYQGATLAEVRQQIADDQASLAREWNSEVTVTYL